jgi:hypothetical protein
MPEVIGFCIYSRKLIAKILRNMPEKNIRWHEMEKVHIPETDSYKVLVPRKLLYYHVHNYWIGLYRWCIANAIKIDHTKNLKKLESLYIPTDYNWRTTSGELGVKSYRRKVISSFPEINNSLHGNTFEFVDRSGKTPFFLNRLIENIEILCDIFVSKCYFFLLNLKIILRRTKYYIKIPR